MLNELYKEICERKENTKSESYTSYLFLKGEDKILKKIGEECTEVILAAKSNEEEEIVKEMADLTYHCLVLLAEKGISLEKIQQELRNRQGNLSKVGDRKEIKKL